MTNWYNKDWECTWRKIGKLCSACKGYIGKDVDENRIIYGINHIIISLGDDIPQMPLAQARNFVERTAVTMTVIRLRYSLCLIGFGMFLAFCFQSNLSGKT